MDLRLEEYYRLLYVAMTRARNELYIYGYTSNKNANDLSWHSLLWRVLGTLEGADCNNERIRIVHG